MSIYLIYNVLEMKWADNSLKIINFRYFYNGNNSLFSYTKTKKKTNGG